MGTTATNLHVLRPKMGAESIAAEVERGYGRLGWAKPRKSDATFLQGAWSGKEIGPGARGSSSLAVHGTTFEFHGADPKEWYKAAFSVYDTTPKQLVITVTDASSHEYAGLASYAICQLADGALTVTGNEPGNPVVPASFDAPGARKFVFRQK